MSTIVGAILHVTRISKLKYIEVRMIRIGWCDIWNQFSIDLVFPYMLFFIGVWNFVNIIGESEKFSSISDLGAYRVLPILHGSYSVHGRKVS